MVQYHSPHFWVYAKETIVGSIHVDVTNEAVEQEVLQAVQTLFKKKARVKNLTVEITKVGDPMPVAAVVT